MSARSMGGKAIAQRSVFARRRRFWFRRGQHTSLILSPKFFPDLIIGPGLVSWPLTLTSNVFSGHPVTEFNEIKVPQEQQEHLLQNLQNDAQSVEDGFPGPWEAPSSNLTDEMTEANLTEFGE